MIVGVEGVWNNLWVRPEFFKQLIVSCDSRWIQAYFDIANEVKYLIPSEQWIRVLGRLIVKCHVKDYKLSRRRAQRHLAVAARGKRQLAGRAQGLGRRRLQRLGHDRIARPNFAGRTKPAV